MTDYHLDQGRKLFDSDGYDDTPEQEAIRDRVRALVDELPDPHRTVVEKRIWKSMTFQEISDDLGMKGRQNAHDYYNRGIQWLREMMT